MQNLTVGHVILIVLLGLVLALFGPFVLFFLLGYGTMAVATRVSAHHCHC